MANMLRNTAAIAATDNPYPTDIPYKFLYCVIGTQTALDIRVNPITPSGPPCNVLVSQVFTRLIGMNDVNVAGSAVLVVADESVVTDFGTTFPSLPPRVVTKCFAKDVCRCFRFIKSPPDATTNASNVGTSKTIPMIVM